MSADLLAEFERFDTATVSDALDSLGLTGVLAGIGRLTTRRPVVGLAATVQLGPDDGTPSTRHLGTAAIDAADDRTVLVVAGGRTDCGGWGGLLTVAAAARGARATVVDGCCRDVDEIEELGYPVFARGGAPATARSRQRELDSGGPVTVGGVRVAPGDVVVADGTGVVVVPRDRAADVLAAAAAIDARERELVRRIRAGEPAAAVLGGNYERMVAGR